MALEESDLARVTQEAARVLAVKREIHLSFDKGILLRQAVQAEAAYEASLHMLAVQLGGNHDDAERIERWLEKAAAFSADLAPSPRHWRSTPRAMRALATGAALVAMGVTASATPSPCSAKGCEDTAVTNGLCSAHHKDKDMRAFERWERSRGKRF